MNALQRRRTYSFDTRSVLLFTALTMGGMGALQAQTGSLHPPSSSSSTTSPMGASDSTAPRSGSKFSSGPSTAQSGTSASAAFDRADANQDGQLSAQEATQLPAIAQRFKELDTDRNGLLSRAEFETGVNS